MSVWFCFDFLRILNKSRGMGGGAGPKFFLLKEFSWMIHEGGWVSKGRLTIVGGVGQPISRKVSSESNCSGALGRWAESDKGIFTFPHTGRLSGVIPLKCEDFDPSDFLLILLENFWWFSSAPITCVKDRKTKGSRRTRGPRLCIATREKVGTERIENCIERTNRRTSALWMRQSKSSGVVKKGGWDLGKLCTETEKHKGHQDPRPRPL